MKSWEKEITWQKNKQKQTNKIILSGQQNARLWQFKCPEQFTSEFFFVVLFCFFWKMIGHRCIRNWCLFLNIHLLYLSPIKSKTKMLQKQMKENGVCLFYNNSSASCLYWFIFRNNTLHLFLVPYPFKIEASLQNSLSLQCTYLFHFWHFSVYGLSLM